MKRSQVKSIANKTGKDIDLYNFPKQRNLVVNLDKKEKKKFLNSSLRLFKWPESSESLNEPDLIKSIVLNTKTTPV